MLEGRGNASGWIVVGLAVASLVAFTGLLYVRGGSGPPLRLSGAAASPGLATASDGLRPSPSAATVATSASPGGSSLTALPSSLATPPRSAVPSATPGPSAATASASQATPGPTRSAGPTGSATAYRLPVSPQPATVALENGQGGCPNLSTGGDVVETKFTLSSAGRLTVTSPSNHRLSGRVQADGSFSVTGSDPVERWVGTLTDTGGTGSYFIVAGGCTEGYETTIAFHP